MPENNHRLKSLFIKPTIACSADCIHCRNRRALYRKISGDRMLTFGEYVEFFNEIKAFGVESLHISGGEPTLFAGLPDLIREGKKHGWFVILNTNGSEISENMAWELVSSGLNAVILSLQSVYPETNDFLRRRTGHWEKSMKGLIALIKSRRESGKNLLITTQTILTKLNFRDLPEILEFAWEIGSDAHGISYLEGDFAGELLPSAQDIRHFREHVLPRLIETIGKLHFANRLFRYAARNCIKSIFNNKNVDVQSYAEGRYRWAGKSLRACCAPDVFAMILPNGDVHPCNMVEYVHAPVVGNILSKPFREIWSGVEWEEFRKNRFEWCLYCPAHLHFHIPLRLQMRQLLRFLFRNPAPEQRSLRGRLYQMLRS